MKAGPTFPLVIKQDGVSARIRKVIKTKNGVDYVSCVVVYVLLGKRRLEWRADLAEAKEAARETCRKIAGGEHMALELNNGDRMIYQGQFPWRCDRHYKRRAALRSLCVP
jgi:hypothetical protein